MGPRSDQRGHQPGNERQAFLIKMEPAPRGIISKYSKGAIIDLLQTCASPSVFPSGKCISMGSTKFCQLYLQHICYYIHTLLHFHHLRLKPIALLLAGRHALHEGASVKREAVLPASSFPYSGSEPKSSEATPCGPRHPTPAPAPAHLCLLPDASSRWAHQSEFSREPEPKYDRDMT